MQQSLWACLHDAGLVEIHSDRDLRTVTLTLQIEHLRRHAELPSEIGWVLECHDVTRLMAWTWLPWPRPAPDTRGLPREQESAAIADWQGKGRTTSIGWDDFEQAVADGGLWLSNADLAGLDRAMSLTGCGHHQDDDRFFEFEIVAPRFSCRRTDGTELDIAALIALGEHYWDDFEQRATEKPPPGDH
jgi:hypothetical protein